MDRTEAEPRSVEQETPPAAVEDGAAPEVRTRGRIDLPVAGASVGIIGLFVVFALILPEQMSSWVGTAFAACADIFGMYWQFLLLATFLIALVLIFTP